MTLGTCPVCNGTKQMPCPDHLRQYGQKNGWYNYRAEDDTIRCNNCGGQTMFGQPTGQVPLRRDNGEPCVHEYTGESRGRCWTQYTCKHCGHQYDIDSSD